jgi:uncharacterized protein (DUF952 family)
MVTQPTHLYKIVSRQLWAQAQETGVFHGAPIDIADGFIHFSTAAQVKETAAKHFAGQDDLLLVVVDANALGDKLIYEVSRGGDLFPHLYAPLALSAVLSEQDMPLDASGHHIFPETLK